MAQQQNTSRSRHARPAMLPLALVVALAAAAAAGVGPRQAAAAGADEWRKQTIYFLLTDRFAQSPGAPPPLTCNLRGWNNGTWAGLASRLDELKDGLGMTAFWITPIPKQLEGVAYGETAYHGYWAVDWTATEPHYGTPDDLRALLAAAKERGMLSMLDIVANHAGPVGYDFASIVPFNRPEHYHSCVAGCTQWCGVPQSAYDATPQKYDLIQTCRLADLPDLNQSHPFVHDALLDWARATAREFPFDGLRIDTVKHVANDFWRDFTEASGVFTLGEVMQGDTTQLPKYVQGPRPPVSALLNFPMYYKAVNVWGKGHDMREFAYERKVGYQQLGRDGVASMGTFVDNHDFPRFLAINPDRAQFSNALAWMLTAEGIPIVYYGSEAGHDGAVEEGQNRQCLWAKPYDRSGTLYRLIAALAKLRTGAELWERDERELAATADCYVFARGDDVLVVTTNRGSTTGNDGTSCSAQLPPGFKLLEEGGLAGVRDAADVGAKPGAPAQGLSYDAATRTLTARTPGGMPRVLVPASVAAKSSAATAHSKGAGSAIMESAQQQQPPPQQQAMAAAGGGAGAAPGAAAKAAASTSAAAMVAGSPIALAAFVFAMLLA